MSCRAASSGGFCAVRAKAAMIRYGSAVSTLCAKSTGMKSATVAVAVTADEDPAVQEAPAQEQVAERSARERAYDRAAERLDAAKG